MVNITDVKQILQFAIDAEIKVFLDGGWGVDALLGYQSRAHNDIDIFVMGHDWTGKFDFLKDYCEVVYLPRTEGISTSKIKGDLKLGVDNKEA